MATVKELQEYVNQCMALVVKNGATIEYATALYKAGMACKSARTELKFALDAFKKARSVCESAIEKSGYTILQAEMASQKMGAETNEISLWYKILKELAYYDFDSYMLVLEKRRLVDERFYMPRRKCLIKTGAVKALQDLEDDVYDTLSLSLPPGIGKTTLEKFFTSWIIGRHPKDYNLFFSHSDDITRMFYDGILDITTSAEYCWGEIFPNVKLRKTDASRQQIDFDKNKPFWSIQCTSRFSKNAGKVRTNRYLLCDDIIGGIEEAMNLNFLDKLWQVYAVDARQRKLNSQVKELHICTRWSVHDIVGRLKKAYDGNPRYKFVAIPDIDPVTGESNFMFEINGMSVEFFNDQRELMDEASYRALYKNEPIEREGLLFPETSLRRYLELPTEPPEEILGQCDCKAKGTDFMVMPILYRYGTDYYAVDCVCNQDSDYEYQYQSLANMIVDLQAQNVEFESNQGGDRVAMEVNKRVTEMGWICNITSKPTETNKEARIYQYSNWVKQHVIFKDKSLYSHQSDYENFMGNLLGYTVAGKNAHDDVPDCLSNLAARQMRKMAKGATVSAITNPFRSGMTVNDIWGY